MRSLFAALAVLASACTTASPAPAQTAETLVVTPPAEQREQSGGGTGTAERQVLEDRVRTLLAHQMRSCWQMPTNLPDHERLVVTVSFDLNHDGTLRGAPRVISPRNYTFDPAMRVAVTGALRAVRTCAPYPFAEDPVLGAHYDTWEQLELTFRAP